MIVLPDLHISRDEYAEAKLYSDIVRWLEREDAGRSPGIHVSDLLDPRIGYWQRINPKPITERQAWFYSIGKALHTLVLQVEEIETTERSSDSGTLSELGIEFSPDLVREGNPIELKTNRSAHEPHPDKVQEDLHIYLEQLVCYMVLLNTLYGHLWVLYLSLKDGGTNRTAPGIRCYTVQMQEEDFANVEALILRIKQQLEEAIGEKDHRQLPLCRNWKCGKECVWWHSCQPEGRYPETDKRKWKG